MSQQELEIKYNDDVLEKFKNHIALGYNQNILFSGKYGTGKTTFLGHFFENNKNEYHSIRLTPVNYVVSSNENIFELIKVDIIKQLHEDGFIHFDKDEELKVDKVSAAIHYAFDKPLDFTNHVVSALSKLHPVLEVATGGVKGVHEFIKDLADYENKLNAELKSKDQILVEHAEKYRGVPGTYFEFDIISKILKSTLNAIKSSGSKTVLIIDDLDRLDPEHIFRILNIFSSHNSYVDNKHKFGFDKVIIVADINNIEVLFRHRYGDKAEFQGYIDKFYSDQIFNFTNDDALMNFIENDLTIHLRKSERDVLACILKFFIEHEVLTIRNIIKYRYFPEIVPFVISKIDITYKARLLPPHVRSREVLFNSNDIQIIYVISILTSIFGTVENLKKIINKFSEHASAGFGSKYTGSFIQAFGLVTKYASLDDDELEMYFRKESYNNGTIHEINFKEYPIGEWMGFKYKYVLKWTGGSPYKGDESFFSQSTVAIIKLNEIIKVSQVMNSLSQVIAFIEDKKYLNQLRICSSIY